MAVQLPVIPPVIGHRGAALHGPENTIAGIEEAARRGARMVEIDVRLTADGQPVIFHDDVLDRTTNGAGPIDAALFDEVRHLDAGMRFGPGWEGERIPTLEEVIAATASLSLDLNIEIKSLPERAGETARVALARAAELWPSARPVPMISSFHQEALVEACRLVPDWPRGLLLGKDETGWQTRAGQIGAYSLNIDHTPQTRESIAGFLGFGRPVLCYTVNDPGRARDLFGWGVTALISDAPDRIAPPAG